ncbi:MAG: hypothetical protein SPI86_05895 [Treponemataceae bacterium]|nr:hypothetical protein [Spirochaetales bacterium]MDY6031275.1 hypothetical protein [Treponemataceae bacterium]
MKNLKKVFALLLATSLVSLVFAQVSIPASPVSLTNVSEVEDFMDVNSFNSLDFEKVFFYAGWSDVIDDGTADNLFNFGVATNFNKLYAAFFYAGNYFGVETSSSTEDSQITKESIANANNTPLTFAALFGINNLGIKATILHDPVSSADSQNNTQNETQTVKSKSHSAEYELFPIVEVGYSIETEKVTISPRANFGYDIYTDHTKGKYESWMKLNDTTSATTNAKSYSKNNTDYITTGIGSTFELPEKGAWAHSFDADLQFDAKVKNYKVYSYTNTVTSGDTNSTQITETETIRNYGAENTTSFTGAWNADFVASDNVTMSFGASIPVSFIFNNPNYSGSTTTKTTVNGTENVVSSSTSTNQDITFTTEIIPELNMSIMYNPIEKLGLYAGADIHVPGLVITSTTTTSGRKTVDTEFGNNADSFGNVTWASGLRLDVSKKVSFDCSYTILQDLFTNFSSNITYPTDFWEGVGKVVFHDFSFLVTVKL